MQRASCLEAELERIVPLLITKAVEKIILFGSLSWDTVNSHSDIDLLIIKHTNKRFLDHFEDVYRVVQPELALDILVYSPGEITEYQEQNSFLNKILSEGIVIYEKEQGIRSFQMVGTGIKRPG